MVASPVCRIFVPKKMTIMEVPNSVKKLAEDCAFERGWLWVRYEGVYEGCFIFEAAPDDRYRGKIGYPSYIAVNNGSARWLEHEECKIITFASPLPPR